MSEVLDLQGMEHGVEAPGTTTDNGDEYNNFSGLSLLLC